MRRSWCGLVFHMLLDQLKNRFRLIALRQQTKLCRERRVERVERADAFGPEHDLPHVAVAGPSRPVAASTVSKPSLVRSWTTTARLTGTSSITSTFRRGPR